MKRVKIDFDFSKWGEHGVSVEFKGYTIQTLHKHPNTDANECFYGINGFGHLFKTYLSSNELQMFELQKPREIWVNEYVDGTSYIHDSLDSAIDSHRSVKGKTTKFIEVIEDETKKV